MLKKIFQKPKEPATTSREHDEALPPGQVFKWPAGATITAIDKIVIALPKALFGNERVIGSVVEVDDEAGIAMPPDSDNVYFELKPGMSMTIHRHSQSYLVAADKVPRRVRVTEPPEGGS